MLDFFRRAGRRPRIDFGEIGTLDRLLFPDWLSSSSMRNTVFHGTCHLIDAFHGFTHFSTVRAAHAGVNRARARQGLTANYGDEWDRSIDWACHPNCTSGHIYSCKLRIINPLRLNDILGNHDMQNTSAIVRRGLLELGSDRNASCWAEIERILEALGNAEWDRVSSDDEAACDNAALAAKDQVADLLLQEMCINGFDSVVYDCKEDHGKDAWITFHQNQVRFKITRRNEHCA